MSGPGLPGESSPLMNPPSILVLCNNYNFFVTILKHFVTQLPEKIGIVMKKGTPGLIKASRDTELTGWRVKSTNGTGWKDWIG